MTQSLKTIIPLALGVFVLMGYSYLGAQAPANPPDSNVAAPVNTSATPQTKEGSFGADTLTVFSTVPSLVLYDESPGQTPFRLRGEANVFQILTDHNLDGNWFNNPGNHPLEIVSSSTNPSTDYARVANDLLATRYCDRSRGNCFTASDIATLSTPLDTSSFLNTSATNQTKAGTLTAGNLFTAGQVRTANLCDAAGGNCTAPANILDTTGTAQTKSGNLSAQNFFSNNTVRAVNYCDTAGGNCTAPANILDTTAANQTKAGNLTANILIAQTQVRSDSYCNEAGGNCKSQADITTTTNVNAIVDAALANCRVCLQCDPGGGPASDGPVACMGVNDGWSTVTGDLSANGSPSDDNVQCRIRMDCY